MVKITSYVTCLMFIHVTVLLNWAHLSDQHIIRKWPLHSPRQFWITLKFPNSSIKGINFQWLQFPTLFVYSCHRKKIPMKTAAVWCWHTCGSHWYFEILWKLTFVDDLMQTWQGDNELCWNHSQLISTEIKSCPTYMKESRVHDATCKW